jgi:hypothetical protein
MGERIGNIDGIILTKENQSTGKKPIPLPLCAPPIPQELAWVRSRASTLKDRPEPYWLACHLASVFQLQAKLSVEHYVDIE